MDAPKISEGLIIKVVLIVCTAWIICAWIDAQKNRFCAASGRDVILDKRTGAVYDPRYRIFVKFGEEAVKEAAKDEIDIDSLPEIDIDSLPIIEEWQINKKASSTRAMP